MKTKGFLLTLVTAVFAAILAVFAYSWIDKKNDRGVIADTRQKMVYAQLPADSNSQNMDFTFAAENAVHAVVHVKTKTQRTGGSYNLYDFFNGPRGSSQPQQPMMGFGSGVIISSDGYIVTNNHVIEGSDEIEVVLNDKRSFTGRVIGADRSTDIALIKVDAKNLPIIPYGNSEDLRLGQWVLAVGNPYNLTSTVTAGIVSAKGRNVGIMGDPSGIEAFIQTDAAVNPGNSGGALVNTSGELVGINTAIASRTGDYSGNSFAVPVSIVKKVVSDLTEFGTVQRSFIGVQIQDINQEVAKEHNIDKLEGVYVAGLTDNGAARDAGIKEGDVILSINNRPVNSVAELQEQVSKYRPNDKIDVHVRRNDNERSFQVTLRNLSGTTDFVKQGEAVALLGGTFELLKSEEKVKLGIQNGVKVASLSPGKLMREGIKEGFVIIQINNQPVSTVEDIQNVLDDIDVGGGVYIEGIYPNGKRALYAFFKE